MNPMQLLQALGLLIFTLLLVWAVRVAGRMVIGDMAQ